MLRGLHECKENEEQISMIPRAYALTPHAKGCKMASSQR